MKKISGIAALAAIIFLTSASSAHAVKMGALGDSGTDEYGDWASGSFGSYAKNWVEQLATYRGVDFGPTGAWGSPRGNGHEYNWALAGATTTTLLSAGQHTGLAGQIASQGISYATLMVGTNDEGMLSNMYTNLYLGNWTPGDANTISWVNTVAGNINTAVTALDGTGVKLALADVVDGGYALAVQNGGATSAAGRQRVADVLANQLRPAIQAIAQSHHLVFMDLYGMSLAEFGPHSALNTNLKVGNVDIKLKQVDTVTGSNPVAAFVDDGSHANTTAEGIIANLVMTALNIGYGAGFTPFSESELLSHAGIAYGGSDTLQAAIEPYSNYIVSYVPEPSTITLAAVGLVGLAGVRWRRKR